VAEKSPIVAISVSEVKDFPIPLKTYYPKESLKEQTKIKGHERWRGRKEESHPPSALTAP
jgi:hypothetical protein